MLVTAVEDEICHQHTHSRTDSVEAILLILDFVAIRLLVNLTVITIGQMATCICFWYKTNIW